MEIIKIPVSLGELYDKISILEIKILNMNSPEKVINITNEYKYLKKISKKYSIDINLYNKLKIINQELWKIEDAIREKEKLQEFDDQFINLARSVYINNDKRSEIKREINYQYNSGIIEEKSYEKY